MKRFITCLICLVSVFTIVSATDIEYRDAKSIKKFINSLPVSAVNNKVGVGVQDPMQIGELYFSRIPSNWHFWYTMLGIKFVSLKDVDRDRLNEVEKNLVDNYFDVWVSNKNIQGYLLVDNTFRIGCANYCGNVLVEPCEGLFMNLTTDGKIVGFGNAMNIKQNSMTTGYGNFSCVLNLETEEFIIQPGQYDFISALMFGIKKKERFQNYIVGKRQENGEMLYGLLDTNGKELKPCQYKGIICTDILPPQQFSCSMTETPEELVAKEQARIEVLRQQERERLARQQEWENFTQNLANSVGNAIGAVYDTATGTTSSSSSYSSSTTNSSSSKATSNTSSSSGNDGNLLQRDRQTYYNWEDQVRKMGTGLTPYNASTLQRAQSAMRNIRTKWEAKGERMYHSEWEDWTK